MSASLSPPWSARRLSWREASFVALDFEMTGLDPERDDVISFGAVPIDGGRIAMARSSYELVRPRVRPSNSSVVVHGLRAQDLKTAPDIQESRAQLAEALRGRFLVTWHAPNENAFLAKLFEGRPSRRSWAHRNIDVRGLAITAGEGAAGEPLSLSATARRNGVPVADPHHALDDALVTAQLFLVMATRLSGGSRLSVSKLLKSGRAQRQTR